MRTEGRSCGFVAWRGRSSGVVFEEGDIDIGAIASSRLGIRSWGVGVEGKLRRLNGKAGNYPRNSNAALPLQPHPPLSLQGCSQP